MNLTFTLTDEQFSAVKENLRISVKHYRDAVADTPESEYAVRILQCRAALGLSNSQEQACYDSPPKQFAVNAIQ